MPRLSVTKSYLDGQDLKLDYSDGHTAIFVRPPAHLRERTEDKLYFLLWFKDTPVVSYRSVRTHGKDELTMAAEGYSIERIIPYMDAANSYLSRESSGSVMLREFWRACIAIWRSDHRSLSSIRRKMFRHR